jgi:hypothetical protein
VDKKSGEKVEGKCQKGKDRKWDYTILNCPENIINLPKP